MPVWLQVLPGTGDPGLDALAVLAAALGLPVELQVLPGLGDPALEALAVVGAAG